MKGSVKNLEPQANKFFAQNLHPALSSNMFYVYALKHRQTALLYTGYTDNLERRCREHQKDKPSWKCVYYEAYLLEKDARARERQLKYYGSALGHLRKRMKYSIHEL